MKDQYPTIAWRSIAGMRDQVIDQYFGVDFQVLWEMVHQDLSPLTTAIAQVLADLTAGESIGVPFNKNDE